MGRSDSAAPGTRFFLRALGAASVLLWTGFAFVSREFAYGTTSGERPFGPLGVIVVLGFAHYLVAVWIGREGKGTAIGGREVLLFAVLMRLPLLLFSHPVQEIDFYRYLWDGRVAVEGISPYRFSPATLDRVRSEEPGEEPTAATGSTVVPAESAEPLVALLERSGPVETIFLRIDHREVPTVYPVVAQAVFAAAARVTPEDASVFVQAAALRALLTLFDLGIVILLLLIGRRLSLPSGFVLAYAWCPLVLKEFANASHMDVIPVFFTVAALFCLVNPARSRSTAESEDGEADRPESESDSTGGEFEGKSVCRTGAAFVFLVFAIFAKWYPVVLLPVFFSFAWGQGRWKGLASSIPALGLALGFTLATLHLESEGGSASGEASGLQTFLTQWEMNDLLFSVVRENLRPPESGDAVVARPEPWYAITPDSWRNGWHRIVRTAESKFGREGAFPSPDFLGAQLLCGGVLALLIAGLSLRKWEIGEGCVQEMGRAVFLALAASWYLSATQNPWYWTWALPFIGFARSRIWLFVSGAALVYYARFWLIYQFPAPFWRGYDGRRFFDDIVVWFEHGPVLLALVVAAAWIWRRGSECR